MAEECRLRQQAADTIVIVAYGVKYFALSLTLGERPGAVISYPRLYSPD